MIALVAILVAVTVLAVSLQVRRVGGADGLGGALALLALELQRQLVANLGDVGQPLFFGDEEALQQLLRLAGGAVVGLHHLPQLASQLRQPRASTIAWDPAAAAVPLLRASLQLARFRFADCEGLLTTAPAGGLVHRQPPLQDNAKNPHDPVLSDFIEHPVIADPQLP